MVTALRQTEKMCGLELVEFQCWACLSSGLVWPVGSVLNANSVDLEK